MTEKNFNNKVVLVTGGSYGIGRAAAVAFAKRGAMVIIADWKEDKDQNTLKEIWEAGGKGEFVLCNVSDPGSVASLIHQIIKIHGRLDAAFNNAGIEGEMNLTDACSEENFDKTIAVNLKGNWLCMKFEIPVMRKQGFGAIVNCASIAGLIGYPSLPAYVASKHGVVGLTKTAALENAKSGIRINAVCPGAIKTPMLDRLSGGSEEMEKSFTAAEPIGRLGKPEEIANAVVWLCSEEASFVTGHAMVVDGGWVAG